MGVRTEGIMEKKGRDSACLRKHTELTENRKRESLLRFIYTYFLFLFGACVNADAATDFAVFDVFGLRSNADALLATCFDVFSSLAMMHSSLCLWLLRAVSPKFPREIFSALRRF